MAVTVVGSGSAAATSVAIPAHAIGDLIIVAARGTAAAPSVPAAGGTVPSWLTLQTGLANSVGLTVVSFVATATNHTTGVFTNATHIGVIVLRGGAGNNMVTAAARSAVGNGNNTQTIVYPALTFIDLDGSSFGVRVGTRGVADSELANAPSGWTNQFVQPAGASALLNMHIRSGVTVSPTSDSVAAAGTNSAYRAVTIEVQEVIPAQSRSVSGVGSPSAFGTVVALAHQKVTVNGVYPALYVPTITAAATLTNKVLVGGSANARLGKPTAQIVVGTRVDVAGLGSAQAFGVITPKARITKTVAGLGSAQAFGAVAIKTARITPVAGLGSAQAFGTTLPKASITRSVSGISSAQAFGAVTTRTGTSKAVGGVPSAQAFGLVKPAYRISPAGLGSAQAFGVFVVHATRTVTVAGIGSAQDFGDPETGLSARNVWIWPTTYVISTGGSITGRVVCGDGHTVGGWDYLPASGRPKMMILGPAEVESLELVPTVSK